MELTPEQLDEWLDVLRDHGASAFSCPLFSVTLGDAPPVAVPSDIKGEVGAPIKVRPAADTHARGIYANSSLWPDGTPPSFPKKSQ